MSENWSWDREWEGIGGNEWELGLIEEERED